MPLPALLWLEGFFGLAVTLGLIPTVEPWWSRGETVVAPSWDAVESLLSTAACVRLIVRFTDRSRGCVDLQTRCTFTIDVSGVRCSYGVDVGDPGRNGARWVGCLFVLRPSNISHHIRMGTDLRLRIHGDFLVLTVLPHWETRPSAPYNMISYSVTLS